MSTRGFVLQRLATVLPVLLGVSVLVFVLLHVIPGDPVRLMLVESDASPERMSSLRAQLGLDAPLPVQFVRFVAGAAHGDLGMSLRTQRPVSQEIADNLPATAQLALGSLLVAASVGVPLGLISAVRAGSCTRAKVLALWLSLHAGDTHEH